MSRVVHSYSCQCTLNLGDDRKSYIVLCREHRETMTHETMIAAPENFPLIDWASQCPFVIVSVQYTWDRSPSAISIRAQSQLSGMDVYSREERIPLESRMEDARSVIEEMFNEARFALETKI